MTIRRNLALFGIGTLALLVAGCGGGGAADDSVVDRPDQFAAAEAEAGAPAEAGPREQATAPEPGSDRDGGPAGGVVVENRSIIFTGHITLRVEDVDAAADQLAALAQRHGGFVGGDRRTQDGESSHATLTLRIPSERFAPAVTGLTKLGTEESRQIETEDVTEEMVDLAARIATARSSLDRTRNLLDQAESVSEIILIEEELSKREARLASLQARERALADLTDLSTITVTLLSPDTSSEAEPDNDFLAGFRNGWDGFVSSLGVLVTAFGWVLPWLIVVSTPVGAGLWWRRRRRSGKG